MSGYFHANIPDWYYDPPDDDEWDTDDADDDGGDLAYESYRDERLGD